MSKLDASDPAEAKEILLCAEKMAPIGGIFHLAMTLKDKLLPNQVMDFDSPWLFTVICEVKQHMVVWSLSLIPRIRGLVQMTSMDLNASGVE